MSESESESESFMIPFFGYLLNYACGFIQMVITVTAVTKNVRMSRHWKAELVA
jgi:hypothetical protein